MKNPRIVAVVGKGGTGKTTSSIALGYELALAGHRVLLVDGDPQASCTQALGEEPADPFDDVTSIVVAHTPQGGLMRLLPGDRALAKATRAETVAHITRASAEVDIVVIDTVPVLCAINLAAISMADLVLVTLQPAPLPMSGLEDMLATCYQVNPEARTRALFTLAKPRRGMLAEIKSRVDTNHPGLLYPVHVPDDSRCEAASGWLEPVGLFAPRCKATLAYRELAVHVHEDLVRCARPSAARPSRSASAPEVSNVAR